MGNYYFLAASLPPLELKEKPEISFEELSARLEVNLSQKDFAKTVVLRRYIDLCNIKALFLEEPIDPRGNLDEKELDEALLTQSSLPAYIFDILEQHETVSQKMAHFPELLSSYFAEEMVHQKGFLRDYLIFERNLRLVLLALRAKSLKRDLATELQFEDFTDPLVMQILAQKDAEEYNPPAEYAEVKEIFQSCGLDPWQLHQAFAEYRLRKIEELVDQPLFSIDWILSYIARLMLVEHWHELDKAKGKMILDTFKAS